ncbi:hypothetical protein LTR20_002851 [Exophiala xenobiotica]|nr:hypothetical protein LTR93_003034 [Exophiala xenobiotica]KAK5390428.1 hypothetical protein LTS13_000509 [Exophiala xenobiotica]KAK5403646.1 hypothetical protein LTR79_000399 [Exophiala xenobiotica]KAK5423135.1 hypothetical protein LTR90_002153 [Exophiala xenobiotica]KAK5468505.1 hypothetical protein LTR20_002851 [Exophiala xenobiotica]
MASDSGFPHLSKASGGTFCLNITMDSNTKTTTSMPKEIESVTDAAAGPDAVSKDVALQLVATSHAEPVDPEQEKRVLRKLDFLLIPLLMLTFMLQYIDKVILNGASQFGIIQDLHLYQVKGVDPETQEPILDLKRFSNSTLIFYWGCLAGLLPSVYLAQRLPIAKFLSCTVMVWGAVVMLTVACDGYHGFLAQRFFLGFTECAVAPGFSIIIAMWWKKAEQPLRYSIWYTSTGLGGLIGSLLIYGIGHIQGKLSPWKYQYLILGAFTILWGVLIFIVLPDNPVKARFLTQEERVIAVERMRQEQTGIENKTFKFYQVKEALVDPKTWIMFATTFCLHFVNGAVSGFGAIIIRSFGYTHLDAILLTGAVGACVFVTLVLVGLVANHIPNIRTILMVACEIPVIIGSVLVWKMSWTSDRGAAIGGFILLGVFAGGYMMMLALSGANTAGHTKKAFTTGLLWSAWGISNGVAPLTIKTPEAQDHYPSCFKTTISTAALVIGGSLALRFYLQWENERRDRECGAVDEATVIHVGFLDQTDRENKTFRYLL